MNFWGGGLDLGGDDQGLVIEDGGLKGWVPVWKEGVGRERGRDEKGWGGFGVGWNF